MDYETYIETISTSSSNKKRKSFWQSGRLKCQQFFSIHHKKNEEKKNPLNRRTSDDSLSSFPSSSYSTSSSSSSSSTTTYDHLPENHPPAHVFSHLKEGYSIFYRRISNGNYIVHVRTADRKIIATYEVEGSMI
ncbi:unnamed protein product [Cunninghamella blakesleeana]